MVQLVVESLEQQGDENALQLLQVLVRCADVFVG